MSKFSHDDADGARAMTIPRHFLRKQPSLNYESVCEKQKVHMYMYLKSECYSTFIDIKFYRMSYISETSINLKDTIRLLNRI